jgi:hypothetical protein
MADYNSVESFLALSNLTLSSYLRSIRICKTEAVDSLSDPLLGIVETLLAPISLSSVDSRALYEILV